MKLTIEEVMVRFAETQKNYCRVREEFNRFVTAEKPDFQALEQWFNRHLTQEPFLSKPPSFLFALHRTYTLPKEVNATFFDKVKNTLDSAPSPFLQLSLWPLPSL